MANRFSDSDNPEAPNVKRRITNHASRIFPQVDVLLTPSRLALVALFLAGLAFAHPSEVLAKLESDPATPTPGVPFTLKLTLEGVDRAPVEAARVQAEFRRKNAPQDTAAIRTDFKVTSASGTYRTELRLPEGGPWIMQLQERTFAHEDAAVQLGFNVRPARNPHAWEFVFAPPNSPTLRTWLFWVVGVPLLAGGVVTAFVNSRKTRPA